MDTPAMEKHTAPDECLGILSGTGTLNLFLFLTPAGITA